MFSSTKQKSADRKLPGRLVPLALLAVVTTGCATKSQQPTPSPLVVDEAMQHREWDRSVAPFPNGSTVSGHNRFPLRTESQPDDNEYALAAYDVGASLAQTVALPFTYLFIPPFAKAVYHGEVIGPSYTAMPVMRPADRTVNVDGLIVDRDTLEVRARPKQREDDRYKRYGAQGPTDTDFSANEPGPVEDFE
jgi:hypothetical protein